MLLWPRTLRRWHRPRFLGQPHVFRHQDGTQQASCVDRHTSPSGASLRELRRDTLRHLPKHTRCQGWQQVSALTLCGAVPNRSFGPLRPSSSRAQEGTLPAPAAFHLAGMLKREHAPQKGKVSKISLFSVLGPRLPTRGGSFVLGRELINSPGKPGAKVRFAPKNRSAAAISVNRRCRWYFGRFATTLDLRLFQQNRPIADKRGVIPIQANSGSKGVEGRRSRGFRSRWRCDVPVFLRFNCAISTESSEFPASSSLLGFMLHSSNSCERKRAMEPRKGHVIVAYSAVRPIRPLSRNSGF